MSDKTYMDSGMYVLVLHPAAEALFLACMTPRERWKYQHREARMRAKGTYRTPISGEAGQFNGVRVVRTGEIK
jgi:hypothetical protein